MAREGQGYPCYQRDMMMMMMISHYPEHLHVFTDGSKDHSRTACAAVLNKIIHKKALPLESSIFTAEVCAIDLALNIISRDKHKFMIFSDSLSVVTSLENKKLENPLMSSHKKNNFVLDSKPHRSERKRKSRLGNQIGLRSKP